jgi:hypothetical protein
MSILDDIGALTAARGPSVVERTIAVCDVSKTFHFRRIPYADA